MFKNLLRKKKEHQPDNIKTLLPGDEPSYATYAEALAECNDGYTAQDLVESVYQRQRAFYHTPGAIPEVPWYLTAGMLTALPLAFRGTPLRVLDFGGSAGIQYALAAKCCSHIPIAKWAVVETTEFVSKAKEHESDALRFFDEIDEAQQWLDDVDVTMTSGAIQYTPDPS